MNQIAKKLAVLLFFFCIVHPGQESSGSVTATGKQEFLLFFANDVLGETEACG